MAEDSLQHASFVRTDEDGLLEFRVDDGRLINVEVTDDLERGIVESKQIIAEKKGSPAPHSEKSLPISMIQTLLRAGEDPQKIAEDYELSEPTVRRFAKPVEFEKKYQIDQFKHSMMPGADLATETVESTLQAHLLELGVRFTDVTWNATRTGHEPWRIQATFPQSGRTNTAVWSFDSQRGTIVCLDQNAKRLFTTSAIPDDPVDDEIFDEVDSRGVAASDESAQASAAARDASAPSQVAGDKQAAEAARRDMPQNARSGADSAQSSATGDGTPAARKDQAHKDRDSEETQRILEIPADDAPADKAAGHPAAPRRDRTRDNTRRKPAASSAQPKDAPNVAASDGDGDSSKAERQSSGGRKRPVFRKWDDIIFGE